jgi:DNA adenine methylase
LNIELRTLNERLTIFPERPILRYHGGKWILAPWIIGFFPEHRVYVEPYGGAASVLLRKERSYAEVYNDLDSEVVNLFRVARDNGTELLRVLALTPFAREEYQSAWHPTDDPLEQARRTVIRAFMGFGISAVTMKRRAGTKGGQPGTGFRANSNNSGTTPAHDWRNFAGTGFRTYTGESDGRRNRHTLPCGDWATYGSALAPIIDRLRGVVIENKDAIEVMMTHDGTKTLHYVDPPYVHTTRDAGVDYQHEMTDDDHRKLPAVLHELKGAVIVSGYACSLYDDELYAGWRRVERKALADGARERTEVLWLRNVESRGMLPGLALA